MKTPAPDAAKVIRKTWNAHPVFSIILQFNTLLPIVTALGSALGLLGAGQPQDAAKRNPAY
jgi:hypothetical protein